MKAGDSRTEREAAAVHMTRQQVREFVRAIPKTEIHLHLEAIASADTIWRLIERHKLSLPGIKTQKQLMRKFTCHMRRKNRK